MNSAEWQARIDADRDAEWYVFNLADGLVTECEAPTGLRTFRVALPPVDVAEDQS